MKKKLTNKIVFAFSCHSDVIFSQKKKKPKFEDISRFSRDENDVCDGSWLASINIINILKTSYFNILQRNENITMKSR